MTPQLYVLETCFSVRSLTRQYSPSHHIAGYIGGGSASDNQNTSLSVEISTRKRPAVLYLHGNDDDLKSLRDLGFPLVP